MANVTKHGASDHDMRRWEWRLGDCNKWENKQRNKKQKKGWIHGLEQGQKKVPRIVVIC